MEIPEGGSLANRGLLLWGTANPSRGAGAVRGAGTFLNESDGILQINAGPATLGAALDNRGVVEQNTPVIVEPGVTPVNKFQWTLKSTAISSDESPTPGKFRNLDRFEVGLGSTIALPFDQEGTGRLVVPAGASVFLKGGGMWTSDSPLQVDGVVSLDGSTQGVAKEYRVQGPAQFCSTSCTTPVASSGSLTIQPKATLSIDNSLDNFLNVTLSGGTIRGPGRFEHRGTLFTLQTGRLGISGSRLDLTYHSGATVNVAGDIPVNGTIGNDGLVNLLPGARLSLEDHSEISNRKTLILLGDNVIGGSGTLRNSSSLLHGTSLVAATKNSVISVPLDNTGTVSVFSGTLSLAGGVVQLEGTVLTGGHWIVEPGAKLMIGNAVVDTVGPSAEVELGRNDVDGSAFQQLRRVDGKITVLDALKGDGFWVGLGRQSADLGKRIRRRRQVPRARGESGHRTASRRSGGAVRARADHAVDQLRARWRPV